MTRENESEESTTSIPPGWYQDSEIPGIIRWWDGYRWSEHMKPIPTSESNPPSSDARVTVESSSLVDISELALLDELRMRAILRAEQ